MSWSEAFVGFQVFEKDFFRQEPDGVACRGGHRPGEGAGPFCSACGAKFEEATKTVPTEALRRWFERPESREAVPAHWDDFGDALERAGGQIVYGDDGPTNLYFWGISVVSAGGNYRGTTNQRTSFEAVEKARARAQADLELFGFSDRVVALHVLYHY